MVAEVYAWVMSLWASGDVFNAQMCQHLFTLVSLKAWPGLAEPSLARQLLICHSFTEGKKRSFVILATVMIDGPPLRWWDILSSYDTKKQLTFESF